MIWLCFIFIEIQLSIKCPICFCIYTRILKISQWASTIIQINHRNVGTVIPDPFSYLEPKTEAENHEKLSLFDFSGCQVLVLFPQVVWKRPKTLIPIMILFSFFIFCLLSIKLLGNRVSHPEDQKTNYLLGWLTERSWQRNRK